MAPPDPTLRQALEAADAAARAGAPAALQAAVRRCVELCAGMEAGGAVPSPGELRELALLHRALLERAEAALDLLGQELARAGLSRQAAAAYSTR